jgi:hypothetical protein
MGCVWPLMQSHFPFSVLETGITTGTPQLQHKYSKLLSIREPRNKKRKKIIAGMFIFNHIITVIKIGTNEN